jgi:tetratricopeptide (TPR) repeat protein
MNSSIDWYIKAIQLLELQRFKEARAAFQQALLYSPNDSKILAHIAQCFLNERDDMLALQFSQEALQQNPQEGLAHFVAALAFMHLRFFNKSEYHIEEALKRNPDEIRYLLAAFTIKTIQDKFEEAKEYIQKASNIAPNDPDVLYYQAIYWQMMDQPQKAQQKLSLALEQNPLIAHQHSLAGDLALNNEDAEDADYHLKEAVRLDPNDNIYRQQWLNAPLKKNKILRILYGHHHIVEHHPLVAQYIYLAIWFGISFFLLAIYDSFIAIVFRHLSLYILPLFSIYISLPPIIRLVRSLKAWGRHSIYIPPWDILLFSGLQIATWSLFFYFLLGNDHFFSISLFLLPMGFYACASIFLPFSWRKKWFQGYLLLLYSLGAFNVIYWLINGFFFPHLAQGLFIGICSLIILFVVCTEADSKKQNV